MAIIHSSPIANEDEDSEVKTFSAFEALSDEWHIFYSVAWVGIRDGRVGDGEADFILAHRNFGLIVVEVKGGGIDVDRGRWTSTGRQGPKKIKNPYVQATASKTALYKWFLKEKGIAIKTGHCVIFPDLRDIGHLGLNAPPEITISMRDFSTIEERMLGVAKKWKLQADITVDEMNVIASSLAPRLSVMPKLSDIAFDANLKLIELTQEQVRAFAGMRRNRRAVVFGGAGTGKTILALEKAAEFESQGASVLLLCYNRLLRDRLSTDPRLKLASVQTFHGLCAAELRRAGLEMPENPKAEWWERDASICLIEAISITERSFDAIVVDEGQDFAKDWIDALQIAGATGSDTPFYIFADEDQSLWPRDWEPAVGWPTFELSINCRNTDQIARRIAPIQNRVVKTKGASGPEAKWTDLLKSDRVANVAARVVDRLLGEGFDHSEITVLCENHETARLLRTMSVRDEIFSSYGGGGIIVETIARYKGLEAPAIVVVLENPLATPDTNAYVAFSRASTYLHVIGSTERKRSLSWM